MKYVSILILTLLFTFSYAETSSNTIQILIVKMQNASDDERFKLMNRFKQELRSLNSTARRDAFLKLQHSLQNSKADGMDHIPVQNINVMKVEQIQNHLQNQQQIQNVNQVQQIVPDASNHNGGF